MEEITCLTHEFNQFCTFYTKKSFSRLHMRWILLGQLLNSSTQEINNQNPIIL